jgi:uncharacterized protein (TIGR00369 family)
MGNYGPFHPVSQVLLSKELAIEPQGSGYLRFPFTLSLLGLPFADVFLPSIGMKELPHTHSCFVCGESNSRGLNLRSESDGKIVRTHFAFRSEHVGFKQTVHGGLTATLLDEIMTWACVVQAKRFAYCAELNVRYLLPVRPDQQIVATAELVANRRGRIFEARAKMIDQAGAVLATATGKYLPLKGADTAGMATDFLGDLSSLLEPTPAPALRP